MPAYFVRSEPGAAELRRVARRESGRVCQRVLMIANLLEGMEHEEAARLAGVSRSAAYEWHNRYEEEGIEGLRDRPRPGRGNDQRGFRGQLPPEAVAAFVHRVAGIRLVASLSVPRYPARDAAAPDRYGPFQIRRIQAKRVDQADPQHRLLEAGPTLSRRHRIYDHPQRLYMDTGPRRPPIRSYRTRLRADIAVEGDQEPSAGDELRNRELEHQPYRNHQPRGAAV